jgi:hypothetical protein
MNPGMLVAGQGQKVGQPFLWHFVQMSQKFNSEKFSTFILPTVYELFQVCFFGLGKG